MVKKIIGVFLILLAMALAAGGGFIALRLEETFPDVKTVGQMTSLAAVWLFGIALALAAVFGAVNLLSPSGRHR